MKIYAHRVVPKSQEDKNLAAGESMRGDELIGDDKENALIDALKSFFLFTVRASQISNQLIEALSDTSSKFHEMDTPEFKLRGIQAVLNAEGNTSQIDIYQPLIASKRHYTS